MRRRPPAEAPHSPRHAAARQAARREFDRWAGSYDRSWLNELVFLPTLRVCLEELARWQAQRAGRPFRLLDVGCGTGALLRALAPRPEAEQLVGLDYSTVMVRRLMEQSAAGPGAGRVQAVVGDSEHLPFADGSFDVLTCCNSFHHYPHQAAVLGGFHRVLRPGGLLILADGFRDNVIGWLVFDAAVASIERNVHHASWSQLRDMIRAAGFAALRQRKVNVLAPLLVNVARR